MKTYPLFFLLEEQNCLVIGGGPVAARKVERLCQAGGNVLVLTKDISQELIDLKKQYEFRIEQRAYKQTDLQAQSIVIAASDDKILNVEIANIAKANNILVNVVNQPNAGNFIVPSMIERQPLSIAISTGGASPVLARLLRARLETLIPLHYGKLAELMAKFRENAKQKFPDLHKRRQFWEKLLSGKISELLFSGQVQLAEDYLETMFNRTDAEEDHQGEVYLVGGGPGEPDLLTFRALRLMQQADVVLFDRLVSPSIVDLVNQDAERIYVGKQRSNHSLPQQDINQLLVDLAKQGKHVLRLKGGDPFIFGRGGEEIELLTENHIPFQVVPGITAASGCSTYAGIPLTHRDYAQSCLFITGHLKDGSMNLNWQALVQPQQTLAVYMGTHGLDILSRELISHGMASDTPAAIIQQGTTEQQNVYTSTLAILPDMPKQFDIKPPSMIIIGEVVKLREKLAWFELTKN